MFFVTLMLIFITTKSGFTVADFSQPTQDNSILEQGNVVTVDVVGESRCPDTTRFVTSQLLPAFRKFRSRLQINYHPYGPTGRTFCSQSGNGTVLCTCQHGPEECRKNALQACVIDALPSAVDYLDIVACIQGPSGFSEAFTKCIANPTVSGKLDQNRMFQCANSDEGRLLMAEHGSESLQFGANIYWVPWIAINGLRIPAAEQHFEDVLCNQYFVPRPPECQTAQA
ncbi:hypothetical protein RB195_020379 [Necator americanus]|uniref:Gamma interferon inducible lysosomal thiol reductase n=1 Tax=Necator americanus TaxID=51031 RepID=A0ABR1CJI5_NECAM